jgi:hypothetical protein
MNCRHAKNVKVIVSKDRDFSPFTENGISPPLLRKEWVRKILSSYSILVKSHGIIDWDNVW